MKSIVFFALFSLAAAQFGGYGRGRGGPGGQGGPGGFERGPGGFEGNTQGNELTYEAKGRLICGLTGVDKVCFTSFSFHFFLFLILAFSGSCCSLGSFPWKREHCLR